MALVPNWRRVMRRAWSIRATVICGALTGVLMALPAFTDVVPPGWFMALCLAANIAAPVAASLLHQKGMTDE